MSDRYQKAFIYKISFSTADESGPLRYAFIGGSVQDKESYVLSNHYTTAHNGPSTPLYRLMRTHPKEEFRIEKIVDFPCANETELQAEQYRIISDFREPGVKLLNVRIKAQKKRTYAEHGQIYTIESKTTGHVYVGSTKSLVRSRWGNHKNAIKFKKTNSPFYTALREEGPENFTVTAFPFPCANKEELEKEELKKIQSLQALGKILYNFRGSDSDYTRKQYDIEIEEKKESTTLSASSMKRSGIHSAAYAFGSITLVCSKYDSIDSFYQVTHTPLTGGEQIRKSFSFKRFGSQADAEKAAIAYYQEIFPGKPIPETHILKPRTNFVKPRNGSISYGSPPDIVVCYWKKDGRVARKKFKYSTHGGFRGAEAQAIRFYHETFPTIPSLQPRDFADKPDIVQKWANIGVDVNL